MSPITRRTKLSPTFAATLANAEAKSNAVAAKDREKEKAAIEARTKMNEASPVRNVKRKCIDTSYDTFDNVPSAPLLPPPSYTEVVNNNRTIPILTQVKQNWYGREILTNHDLGLPEVIKRCIYLLLYKPVIDTYNRRILCIHNLLDECFDSTNAEPLVLIVILLLVPVVGAVVSDMRRSL
tara:strand:- start:73 stop:615 length:543 start_codon:yes stop_codon:yes gene_type:complete